MKIDNYQMNELLDWYGCLLTEKQFHYMSMHYYNDYSLSEIAENTNTTRSAVYDIIKRSQDILLGYEKKLQLVSKNRLRITIYQQMKKTNEPMIQDFLSKLEHIDD